MGKVDQGVFTFWMLSHHFGRPLQYIGFGGAGRQVRDLLHVEDLLDLLDEQLQNPDRWDGTTVNVGGGRDCSLSLREATSLCVEITGNTVKISGEPQNRPGDVPLYISDCRALQTLTDWRPRRDSRAVLADIHAWICAHERELARAL
jgi:CDP-paratose 2-epimerase